MKAPLTFGLTDEDPVHGSWMNQDLTEIVNIYKVAVPLDPRNLKHEAHKPVYFATKEDSNWTFWTGTRHKRIGSLADGRGVYEKTPIDEDTVARHKAFCEWYALALGG